MVVIWAHLVSCSLQSVLICLLPAWLAGPVKIGRRAVHCPHTGSKLQSATNICSFFLVTAGGLGYAPLDIGLAAGGAGLLLRCGAPLGIKKKLDSLLASSPARALRYGICH